MERNLFQLIFIMILNFGPINARLVFKPAFGKASLLFYQGSRIKNKGIAGLWRRDLGVGKKATVNQQEETEKAFH
ncbi:hypothetical protein [Rufibacter aurantiacus]|uniref:hypothetical protein n=1 Tax=Rufibacter aurantiacus TaxID=2817374 RepID=UPI001B30FD06|nr:hypothetical protein [Rufibacter aurantiacus]